MIIFQVQNFQSVAKEKFQSDMLHKQNYEGFEF